MPGSTDTALLRQRLEFRHPAVADGAHIWRIARDSGTLDCNAPYAYLLWCRDFAATSIVAVAEGEPAGFITGYVRPDRPDTLMVWQVAVAEAQRGQGVGARMLDALVDGLDDASVCRMETTVTLDNEASVGLFTAFARSRGCGIEREPLFRADQFPDGHDTEVLFSIGPWQAR